MIVRETDSESSVIDVERSSVMALSSSPAASLTASTGASAIAVTVTGRLRAVSAVSPFSSVAMAVTARTISPEKSSGGVIVRPPSWSPVSVTLPSALTVPAERTAPSGMPEMVISRLSEPSRSVSRASRSSAIGLSSVPEAGVTASTGASATASTVTVRLSVVVAVLPLSSIVVAVTVRSMSPEKSAGGVIVRPSS